MPTTTRPRRLAAAVAAALAAACAAPVAAQAACPVAPTTKAFKQFGDLRDYSLAPGGHFEAGTAGWSLTRASVVAGNESFKVRSATDAHSLAIQPTGLAVTPAFCAGVEHPTFRFFARQTSGSFAVLYVKLRATLADGRTSELIVGALQGSDGHTTWKPSKDLLLSNALPLWRADQTASVRLVFDPMDQGGAWVIDDVYVDPARRG